MIRCKSTSLTQQQNNITSSATCGSNVQNNIKQLKTTKSLGFLEENDKENYGQIHFKLDYDFTLNKVIYN